MHVAVTGASSGIGAAIARELGASRASVTLVARRQALLEELAKELPGRTHVDACDLSDVTTCTGWIDRAVQALGPIDVLINNAGVQISGPFVETDPVVGERLVALDLLAPMRIARAVIPGMVARKNGAVVSIASLAAIAPTPGMAYYNAAKAGFAAFSEALAGELRGTGVHVLTVYPGPVATALAEATEEQYGRLPVPLPKGTTDRLARKVRRAIERKSRRIVYPGFYRLARWFPGLTRCLLDRLTPMPKA